MLAGGSAQALTYSYVDSAGVMQRTDQRPVGRRYTTIELREAPRQESPGLAGESGRFSARTRSRYASQVEAAAQASRIAPALIHAVISAESGYNPSARSPVGAVGLMQLMPATAARYRVKDRLDPAENIRGGTHYLRDLLHLFNNDLSLALAAYNAGEHAVIRYGNRIPPYRATRDFVPRVLAYYREYLEES